MIHKLAAYTGTVCLLLLAASCAADKQLGNDSHSIDPAARLPQVLLLEAKPDSAYPEQWIVLLGTGFDQIEGARVLFGQIAAQNITWSADSIDVQVPSMAPGTITLTIEYGGSSLPGLPFAILDRENTQTAITDSEPPDTIITLGPSDPSSSSSADFTLSGSDNQSPTGQLHYTCRMDSEAFSLCGSNPYYENLSDGAHRFEAAAIDEADNKDASPAVWQWTIDTSVVIDVNPPQTIIQSHPSVVTGNGNAQFAFLGIDDVQLARLECQLDNAAFAYCTSPLSLSNLSTGRHTFSVRAVDANNNIDPSPANWSWTYTYGTALTVVAGSRHACVIKTDGSLWCFGDNDWSQIGGFKQPLTATAFAKTGNGWQAVSLGNNHSCALKQNHSLWCWGNSFSGAAGFSGTSEIPVQVGNETSWEQVSAGGNHTCARKADNSLWCWGYNNKGQVGNGSQISSPVPTPVSPGTQWLDVSAGAISSCGIQSDHSLWCWGSNNTYQVGQATTTSFASPVAVNADGDWVDVEVGSNHACARKTDLSIWCWGSDSNGQLGNAGGGWGSLPTQVSGGPWSSLVLGGNFSCATEAGGQAYCWGDNSKYQITDTTIAQIHSPTTSSVQGTSLAAGYDFACAVTQDQVYCAGNNNRGQLGRGFSGDSATPVAVTGIHTWVTVSTAYDSTCAIDDSTALWCWGDNYLGRLGTGLTNQQAPVQVTPATGWRSVASGWYHQCAISDSRDLWCWGDNNRGQLGNNKATGTLTSPTQVSTSSDWKTVEAGEFHTCGLKTNNSLWCWGYGSKGQLGNGGLAQVPVPTKIGTSAWRSLAAGRNYTCGIQANSSLWCWGDNYAGQLGDGTTGTTSVPVQVGAATDWKSVSAFSGHSCGIRSGGSLWCWGANYNYQLARLEYQIFVTPQAVGSGYTWKSVAVGSATTCALTGADTLYCWGGGWKGQNGLGTWLSTADISSIPGSSWQSISLGEDHSCGITSLGKTYCWGSNASGQLGNTMDWLGTTAAVVIP